ncbi:MAG TPA: hypothetical protein VK436_03410, partial [Methanocella sp.]|nr:hypothetical protein [Methanocella sp.]
MEIDYKTLLQIFEVVLLLLLSIAIVVMIPKFREIVSGKAKLFLYIILGLILFVLVGLGFNIIQDMYIASSTQYDAISILYPYVQFYPLFILSIGLSGVVLVTFMEGDFYGYIFAGTGFAMLIPDILKYADNGRFDLLLLGFALWAMIPVIWVFFFRDLALEEPSLRERSWAAIKASLFSYPIYAATAGVAI